MRSRALLKHIRDLEPVNRLATSVMRWMFGIGRAPGWLVRHLPKIGKVDSRLPNGAGLHLWSLGDDWISNQVFWRGWRGHEPETTSVFFRLAQAAEVTIDIGAYVGYYTLLAAHANRLGRVIALEPLPNIHARLLRHIELNALTNVECLMAAAGAREGTADFFHQSHELPTSSSLSQEFMAGVPDLEVSRVPVVTIDRLVRDRLLPRVDLVKVDTESTEPDVLEGMRETLARDRPWIVCEVLKGRGAESRLGPLLEPHGYRFYLLTPEGLVLKSRIEGHPAWLNYLFAARRLPAFEAIARN
jgi:FkbM family methyltransferase